METLTMIIGTILMGVLVWFMIKGIRQHPEWFTKENLTKAFSSMGFLAIILIAFVAMLVFLLNSSAPDSNATTTAPQIERR